MTPELRPVSKMRFRSPSAFLVYQQRTGHSRASPAHCVLLKASASDASSRRSRRTSTSTSSQIAAPLRCMKSRLFGIQRREAEHGPKPWAMLSARVLSVPFSWCPLTTRFGRVGAHSCQAPQQPTCSCSSVVNQVQLNRLPTACSGIMHRANKHQHLAHVFTGTACRREDVQCGRRAGHLPRRPRVACVAYGCFSGWLVDCAPCPCHSAELSAARDFGRHSPAPAQPARQLAGPRRGLRKSRS